jgi:hypothetical protein
VGVCVEPNRHRRRDQAHHARRSGSRQGERDREESDLKLAQVPKYVENYVTPMTKAPLSISQTDKQAWAQAIVDKAKGVKGVTGDQRHGQSQL